MAPKESKLDTPRPIRRVLAVGDTSSHKGVQSVLLLDDEVLCNIALPMMPPEEKFDIDQILADAQTPAGRARVLREIFRSGTAVYGYDPSDPKVLIETSPNGARRRGRFFDGHFVALP
jgi:hypothetical protein